MNKINPVETKIFYLLLVIPALIFILTPSHSNGHFYLNVELWLDKYLFGNGYYHPSNYPFAAKLTNCFSVLIAVIAAWIVALWRGMADYKRLIPIFFGVLYVSSALRFFLCGAASFRKNLRHRKVSASA